MLIPVGSGNPSFLIFWAEPDRRRPGLMLAGDNAKPEQIEEIRETLD